MKLKKLIIMIAIFIICILIGKEVNAMTIVLDPGHGGRDTGAIAKDGETYERDVNLKITRYLRDYFMPSIRPKGHWINIDKTHSKCDRCESVFEIVSANGEANYCPNCGCFMSKGGNHEH